MILVLFVLMLMLAFVILFVAIDCTLDNKISGEKDCLLMQGLPVNTSLFITPIPVNTVVNIFDIVGLDKYRFIVDNIFGLSICGQKVDISNFCTIGATRTIVFL